MASAMKVRRLTGTLGAEVWADKSLETLSTDEVIDAMERYGVLAFRGVEGLSTEDFVSFGARLGRLELSAQGASDFPELTRLTHDAQRPASENIWHTDMSFRASPPLGALLRAIEIPQAGGDTVFADMRWVFDRLPDAIREALTGLEAEHDIAKHAHTHIQAELHEKFPPVSHPVLQTHPMTKEAFVYVNAAYTTRVRDVSPADSDALLQYLSALVTTPECQCRVRWDLGTVVLWDNRDMQHYAVGDYFPAVRTMERLSIAQ